MISHVSEVLIEPIDGLLDLIDYNYSNFSVDVIKQKF